MYKFENDLNSFIWIKINVINSKEPIYFGGGYRQYTFPCEMGIKDSQSAKNQLNRFSSILNTWSSVLQTKCDAKVSMDSNIDFYPLTKHHNNYLDKKYIIVNLPGMRQTVTLLLSIKLSPIVLKINGCKN